MEVLITAKEALEIHHNEDQERLQAFNTLVKGHERGFRVMDTNSNSDGDKLHGWIVKNADMLIEAGYVLKFIKAAGTSQSQWNYAEVKVGYKEEV